MSERIVLENVEYRIVPTHPDYFVSYCGKVIRGNTKKHLKKVPHGAPPYPTVRTCTRGVAQNTKVHRMLAHAWIPNDDPISKTQVNHKDGDKNHCHGDNLEWVTGSQNQRHAISSGLKGKGDELYNSTFTEEQVHTICQMLVDGFLVKDIANIFDCSKDVLRKIKSGDTYFHIRVLYEVPHTYGYDFSESTVRWVCEKINEGRSDKWIAENSTNSNLTIIQTKRIRYKIRYKFISDEYF